jgi:hypothetical protein
MSERHKLKSLIAEANPASGCKILLSEAEPEFKMKAKIPGTIYTPK